MKFKIEKEVFDRFPNLIVAIPVVLGFDNTKPAPAALEFLRSEEKSLKERFTLGSFMEDIKVTSYLDVFRKFGADTTTRLPAHVALSKRILEGGSLPDINPIVNLYNALSIKYSTPFGGEDLASLYGDFVLKFAKGDERWIPIGGGKGKVMFKGDLVWGDDLDISTPSLNWRQCDRTKLIKESRNGYFIMDGFSDVNYDVIQKASEEFSNLMTKFFGGNVTIYWLSKDNPEVEAPFETKKITEGLLVKPKIGNKTREIVKKEYSGNAKIIVDVINQALEINNASVEFASDAQFGDYTSNIAMTMFSNFQIPISKFQSKFNNPNSKFKNPRELAEKIIELLKTTKELINLVGKIETAGPGFINFWLKKDVLVANLIQIGKAKEKYGSSDSLKGKKIMFEYGDANTHKLPHLGHLFSYTYGEAATRILAFAGADVRKVCYQGDIGLHVAKCLWAFQKENPPEPEDLEEKIQLLQKMYQVGSAAFDDDKNKEEIKNLNKAIYDPNNEVHDLWIKTRSWSIDYYKKFEKELNVSYDRYYYESEVYKKGQEIVEKNEGTVFKRSDGALIFEGSKYGLHDRVFVTKYGTPTYEAKDMYLQELKMTEWPMDLLVITTAYEQNGYFGVIFKALETLNPKYIGKLKHIGFGMVNLKSGKMSSRTGEILGAIDVIQKVKELSKNQNSNEGIAGKIAIGAIKYSFLKNNPLQSIAFDLEESIAKEGNSGPYLQYTIARCNSVIQKALTFKGLPLQGKNLDYIGNETLDNQELNVLRLLIRFSEVIEQSASTYSPNILCNYLYELAQKFNSFYNADKIIDSENQNFRLALTGGVGQVLKNGLNLLGIQAPERM